MLLDQINRYNKKSLFKLVNVEKILSKGLKIPTNITNVPTLMIMPSRTCLSGKQLFDYLLLPNKGILFKTEPSLKDTVNNNAANNNTQNVIDEPLAFAFIPQRSSDMFTYIEEEDTIDNNKYYNWSTIQEPHNILTPQMVQESSNESSTRSKSNLPDVSQLKAERDVDIQNYLNTTALPPASGD